MKTTNQRRPSEVARDMSNQIRKRLREAEAEGFDHEQALMIAAGYVAGRHSLGIARVAKLLDLLDRDTDALIAELDDALRNRRVGF